MHNDLTADGKDLQSGRKMLPKRSLLAQKLQVAARENDTQEGIAVSSNWERAEHIDRSPFTSFGTETKRFGYTGYRDRPEFVRRSLSRELEPLRSHDMNLQQTNNPNTKLVSVIQFKNSKLKLREQELHKEILSLSDDLQTIKEEFQSSDMQNKMTRVALEKKREELEQRKDIKQRQVTRVMFLLQKREEILSALLRPETGLTSSFSIPKAILQLVSTGKVQNPRFRRIEHEESEQLNHSGSHSDDEEDSINVGIGIMRKTWMENQSEVGEEFEEQSSEEIVGNIEHIRELTDEEVDQVVFCTAEMKKAVARWLGEETQRLFREKTLVG